MQSTTIDLPSADDTARLGQRLAGSLGAGDTLLLSGPIGAGKSHLARSIIHALLGAGVEVPSPTFTLVQTYDGPEFEIWHADLYRLNLPEEAEELGLFDAFATALCLVEWPDRLGDEAPAGALHIDLQSSGDGRVAHIRFSEPRWAAVFGALLV